MKHTELKSRDFKIGLLLLLKYDTNLFKIILYLSKIKKKDIFVKKKLSCFGQRKILYKQNNSTYFVHVSFL